MNNYTFTGTSIPPEETSKDKIQLVSNTPRNSNSAIECDASTDKSPACSIKPQKITHSTDTQSNLIPRETKRKKSIGSAPPPPPRSRRSSQSGNQKEISSVEAHKAKEDSTNRTTHQKETSPAEAHKGKDDSAIRCQSDNEYFGNENIQTGKSYCPSKDIKVHVNQLPESKHIEHIRPKTLENIDDTTDIKAVDVEKKKSETLPNKNKSMAADQKSNVRRSICEDQSLDRSSLKQQLEKHLLQQYEKYQENRKKEDETNQKPLKKPDKVPPPKKSFNEELKQMIHGKSQGEALRIELHMRLQRRHKQLEECEMQQKPHKQKHHRTKRSKPVPPPRVSSLSNPTSPACRSLASSRETSRSPSPTLPSFPQKPSYSMPSSPSSPTENPIINKLKGLPQVIPPGVPPTLKKCDSIFSTTIETSQDNELEKINIAQFIPLTASQNDDQIKIVNDNDSNYDISEIDYSKPIAIARRADSQEDLDKMSISWPIQPATNTNLGEFIKISTQKDVYNKGNNPSNNTQNSSSFGQKFDPMARSFSPVNNSLTYTQNKLASSDNRSNFRSFSPINFEENRSQEFSGLCDKPQSGEQKYQLDGSNGFKKNPGKAERVYGSDMNVNVESNIFTKLNIQDGRKTIAGYGKNERSLKSFEPIEPSKSSDSRDMFSFLTSGLNNLIGSKNSIESNATMDIKFRSQELNIKGNAEKNYLNIRVESESNISVGIDSSSDNGNDSLADLDQTSDSIPADAFEMIDTFGHANCRNPSCSKSGDNNITLIKTCHFCGTVYCSRICRRSHWEKHKKLCHKIRANISAKDIVSMVRDREICLDAASAVGRRGALGLGRGVVKMYFPDIESADSFVEGNYTPSMHYHTASTLMPNEMCPDVYKQLMEMCRLYNSDHKFILYVSICVNNEITSGPSKCKRENVSRAAKIKLFDSQKRIVHNKNPIITFKADFDEPSPRIPKEPSVRLLTFAPGTKDDPSGQIERQKTPMDPNRHSIADMCSDDNKPDNSLESKSSEALILTPIDNLKVSAREARQIYFHNILRHLRERRILLRTQYPEVYKKLSIYADVGETFPPLTIHPQSDDETDSNIVCVIMPEPDQIKIRKIKSEFAIVTKIDITKPPPGN